MAQHAILRLRSTRRTGKAAGSPSRKTERTIRQQPDIDTSRSKYNFHIVKPRDAITTSFRAVSSRLDAGRRKDSTRFVDTLITASPSSSRGNPQKRYRRSSKGRQIPHWPGRTGKYRVGGGTHDEKTPHLHLDLCSADKGQPPVR